MGARDHTPSVPAGLEAREWFEAYVAARRRVERAEHLLADAIAAADAAASEKIFLEGVALARRRLKREEGRRDATFARLADNLPPHAGPWFLPDDA